MSYIDPHDVLTLSALLMALTWLGFVTDASRIGKALPGVVCILVCGSLLANFRIVPFSSGAADFVGQYIVPAAIPLLMIKADLRRIFIESGRVMLAFAAACVGIVAGVVAGFYLLQPWHVSSQVAGFYTGGFIGGTISMIAVGNAVKMTADDISVATGASMIPSILGLMALISLPNLRLIRRLLPCRLDPGAQREDPGTRLTAQPPRFQLTHITGALALSLSICALARLVEYGVGTYAGHDQRPYNILYVTSLTIVVANLFPRPLHALRGEFELGMIFMYMFFAVIGMGTNLTTFLDHAVSLFFYVVFLLAVGIAVTFALCKLLKLDLSEAITGCGAAIVGPAATVALVAGKGWSSMISPAVMTGIFCHIAGNFIGITVATLLS